MVFSFNAEWMYNTECFALNILPKTLLKRNRQEGNQTACSLYPELTGLRFEFPGLLKILLSNQVGEKYSTNQLSTSEKYLLSWNQPQICLNFSSQEYQLLYWKVRWSLLNLKVGRKLLLRESWRLVLSSSRPWWMHTFKVSKNHNQETHPILSVFST